ncbi:MAG: hypothetical protein ACK4F9_05045, partial [Brevinematia bacterium]
MEYGDMLDKVLLLALSEAEDKGFDRSEMEKVGLDLFDEFLKNGYIRKTPSELLSLPMYSFAFFLKLLYEHKGECNSPIARYSGSDWMRETSICFVNVRSTSPKNVLHGDFINAVKVLPCLRVNGIHLSPFFDHAFRIIYAIDCLSIISDDFINKFYLSLISAYDQVRFFIKTSHLLGKVVGFDLEPHTSQFSRIVLTYPEFFRWIKLQKYGDGVVKLADNLSQKEQLSREYQSKIHEEVREIVREKLKKFNLKVLYKGDVNTIRTAHLECVYELVMRGLWTIPSHTWNGVGVPEFSHYVENGNYPEFKYINLEGRDHRDHAFGILTPYKFYDNIMPNSFPDPQNPPRLDRKVLNFFSKIPLKIIEKFGFDFVRWDYTDHVFDSIYNGNFNFPVSDRITPYVIRYTISKVRKKFPNVGMFFERMGYDFKNYYKLGADLILGGDIWYDISKDYIKKTLKLSRMLENFNSKRKRKISVSYAVDTHDTENPVIDRNPLLREGQKGLLLRFFLSRFGSAGEGIRPKYECIGLNEGTVGLYKANISLRSLSWKNDIKINTVYHNIEDTYQEFYELIKDGSLDLVRSRNKVVFWRIRSNKANIWCFVNLSSRKVKFNFGNGIIIKPYSKDRIKCDGVF